MKAFQFGDKVRVIKTMPEWRLWNDEINKFVGEVGNIIQADNNENPPNCKVAFESKRWWIPNECLELVTATEPKQFTITEPLQSWERF